ncbi:hypothetical protein LPJ66_000218 [Kickxella alabastrina]|uniref:Uncharacterized protein n=1 Tax=Kickxella alabastrina TaxID=61397 RepID=A0ACC1IWT3_9FUNG|nr:hypothetical protein LPJ66_000218 [Kickxella alabastrina]
MWLAIAARLRTLKLPLLAMHHITTAHNTAAQLHTHTDAVGPNRPAATVLADKAIKALLTSNGLLQTSDNHTDTIDSNPHKEVGRRRTKLGTGRCNESPPIQSRLLIRQRLSEKLESEYQNDLKALEQLSSHEEPTQRHILVRELIMILRRFGNVDFMSMDQEDKPGVNDMVEVAWKQYRKIYEHPQAPQILAQIPLTSLSLLICELNFMPESHEYLVRFTRIVRIFRDFALIGQPITTPLLFSMYLRALNKLGNRQLVLKEVAEYRKASAAQEPSVLSVNIMRQVIAAHFGSRRPDLAMEVFAGMKADPEYTARITPHVYSSVIGGAMRAKVLTNSELSALVEGMLDELVKPSYHDSARTGLLNGLLHLANKQGNPGFLVATFEQYLAHGMPINYTTFGIMLHCACHLETDIRRLHRVYQLMVSNTATYDKLTHHIFAIFINNFVRKYRVDYALSVLQDLKAHPTARYTTQHLSHIFDYYAKNGMASRALGLYRQMVDEDKLVPTWPICMDIVKALKRGGDYDWQLDVPDKALQFDMHPERPLSEDALLAMMVKYGVTGRVSQMFDMFFAFHQVQPHSILHFAVILIAARDIANRYIAYVQQGSGRRRSMRQVDSDEGAIGYAEYVEQLRQVRDQLIETSKSTKVPRNMYNMAISVFAMIRDHESTQVLYDHMTVSEGMEPNTRTFNVLLQSFARGSDMSATQDILKDIKHNKMHLNRATGNAMIFAAILNKSPRQAISVYAHMVGRPTPLLQHLEFKDFVLNVSVDVYTIALLIKGLVQCGMLKEAIIVFEDAFGLLPFVPRQLLETLLSTLEECSHVDFAQLCLRRYAKRVEDCQSDAAGDMLGNSDGEQVGAPERLPLSYFGYLLDPKGTDNSED